MCMIVQAEYLKTVHHDIPMNPFNHSLDRGNKIRLGLRKKPL